MRVRKTRQDQRNVYRYPVSVEDGRGGYRTVYTTVKPGEKGVTEVWIRDLHRMDDNEVANNVKNGHPRLTSEQKADAAARADRLRQELPSADAFWPAAAPRTQIPRQ